MDKLSIILKQLDKTNDQRRKWLYLSSIVFIGIAVYIAFWNWIHNLENPFIEWTFISVGLVITVNWWYWTMHLVRRYLEHQKEVLTVLSDIVQDVKIVKADVKSLNTPVDNKN